ncbi:MAG: aminotransferase [Burkholderiales bacterium RIFCSPLOWO2_12_FULL_61_40]|nr:MAG: aminotransferase [Burkholderiales bacterium RIFCSPLOWO2_12_FULL_61_40]
MSGLDRPGNKPVPLPARLHGGPDAAGVPRFDFSTNSNACGPCPAVATALQQADATRYPDPHYTRLRTALAAFHGVDAQRVVLAGSASEFIFRITAWVAQHGARRAGRKVCVPPHAYGDYAQAAQAWGLGLTTKPAAAQLIWACEPSSPLGGTHTHWPAWLVDAALPLAAPPSEPDSAPQATPLVLDCAYAPLRLSGAPTLDAQQMACVWQMYSPNKALGLTGVRAAYAIAPLGAEDAAAELERLAPSWPLGAHGVALLQTWVQPEVQTWLTESLHTLRRWKTMQIDMLKALGWTCLPSDTNFFCAHPANTDGLAAELKRLRAAGIKLRDATSFGLPGHVRLSVQPPVAQDALRVALGVAN